MGWRGLLSAIAVMVAAGTVAVPSAAEAAPASRWAGQDRYETAAAVSRATFPGGADTVFLADGEQFPDALSGGPAAARADGPLLLTRSSTLPAAVSEEIRRLQPSTIYLLGGRSAIDPQVEAQLATLSPATITRLAGADRYATAAAVAGLWESSGVVYLASGEGFADGLSAGAAATRVDAPLLLSRSSRLSDPARATLRRLDPSRVVVVGGTAAMSAKTMSDLAATLPDADTTRVAGLDRYETSAQLLRTAPTGASTLMLASGADFADALAGVPASAHHSALLAITSASCMSTPLRAEVDSRGIGQYVLLGGRAALSDDVVTRTCPPKIHNLTAPRLSGTPKYRERLSVSTGTWSVDSVSYRYRWLRDGTAISGATKSSYVAGPHDVGHRLSARVTAVRAGYASTSATTPTVKVRHRVSVRERVTYRVETRGHVGASVSTFRRDAAETLNDPRGWRGIGIEFEEVRSGGDFTLYLSQAERVPDFSSGCSSAWSCRVGRNVIINEDRWLHATSSWRGQHGSLRSYRHMVVNHEVGHWLGHGHRTCPRRGALAPVMQQQSKGLQGCTINPWPTSSERHAPRFGF